MVRRALAVSDWQIELRTQGFEVYPMSRQEATEQPAYEYLANFDAEGLR
jgi:hypothetical protein